MSEKHFSGPEDLVKWFKENPDMLGPFPWGQSLVGHFDSIHAGCKCNLNARKANVDKIYSDIVTQIIGKNESLASMIKNQLKTDKVTFSLAEKVLLEINDE